MRDELKITWNFIGTSSTLHLHTFTLVSESHALVGYVQQINIRQRREQNRQEIQQSKKKLRVACVET